MINALVGRGAVRSMFLDSDSENPLMSGFVHSCGWLTIVESSWLFEAVTVRIKDREFATRACCNPRHVAFDGACGSVRGGGVVAGQRRCLAGTRCRQPAPCGAAGWDVRCPIARVARIRAPAADRLHAARVSAGTAYNALRVGPSSRPVSVRPNLSIRAGPGISSLPSPARAATWLRA